MNVYQKYKDAQGRKSGPWFMKYPICRDPLTGKIKYKIEKEVLAVELRPHPWEFALYYDV